MLISVGYLGLINSLKNNSNLPVPYVSTGTLVEGFESLTGFGQITAKALSLDSINKVQGSNSLRSVPTGTSNALTLDKAIQNLDPMSLGTFAVHVKLNNNISRQSISSVGLGFRVNNGGTLYTGASRTVLNNIATDGLWLSGNIANLNPTFQNAGVGNHGFRISTNEANANVGELNVDGFYKAVSANEPALVGVTIDDIPLTAYNLLAPALRAAGIPITWFVPVSQVGTGGKMTVAMLQECAAAGDSIQINADRLDRAITIWPTVEDWITSLNEDKAWFISNGLPEPTVVCWTFGFMRQPTPLQTRPGNTLPGSGTSLTLSSVSSSVTVSVASIATVTWTAHGLIAGDAVKFSTDGNLPTGINAGTVYYVRTVPNANTFTLAAAWSANMSQTTAISTSGTQAGTHTGTGKGTVGVYVGNTVVMAGTSDNCVVASVPDINTVTLSEPSTIAGTNRIIDFLDTSHPFDGNKPTDALIAAGYELARSTINADLFVHFGYSRRAGMQIPSYGANGQTAATLLGYLDSSILRKALITYYFHGISSGEFPESEISAFVSGLKSRLSDTSLKAVTLPYIHQRYKNAKPPNE